VIQHAAAVIGIATWATVCLIASAVDCVARAIVRLWRERRSVIKWWNI
jgi:hypothetical protein